MRYKFLALLKESIVVNDRNYPRSYEIIIDADNDLIARGLLVGISMEAYNFTIKEVEK